jgi:hypothetical protein
VAASASAARRTSWSHPNARAFGVPEVDRGAMGGGAHLQRLFPVQKVRYMYFTGEMIDAQEAYRLGAIERVVPRDQLRATAREIAAKIAAKSPAMIRLAKEALNGIEDGNLEDKYRSEQGFTLEAYTTKDSQEARDAFVQKRDAKFESADRKSRRFEHHGSGYTEKQRPSGRKSANGSRPTCRPSRCELRYRGGFPAAPRSGKRN